MHGRKKWAKGLILIGFEREKEKKRDKTIIKEKNKKKVGVGEGGGRRGMEIRHTVFSRSVPKLGLEFKWVKGNVLVYHPTTRASLCQSQHASPCYPYYLLVCHLKIILANINQLFRLLRGI